MGAAQKTNTGISKRGFTIIEVIVVIGISAILAGAMLVYSRQGENQILLNIEKANMAQEIFKAKELALAGFTKPIASPAPCSYGFHIDYNSGIFYLFEYLPPPIPPATPDCSDIFASAKIDTTNPAYYHETSSGTLTKGVKFGAGANRLGFIVFIPPDPKVLLFDESGNFYDGSSPAMKVYLTTQDGSLSTSISVNKTTGQLSF